jgi:hypothetical protein
MLSRPASRYEKSFLKTEHGVQFAAVVKHPKYVDAYIDKVLKTVSAFNVRFDGRNLHWVEGRPEILTVPSSVKGPFDACEWAFKSLNERPISERAAWLAVRDTMIVGASNHGLLDGGSMASLCHARPIVSPKFPVAVDEHFKNDIAKITKAEFDAYMDRASQFTIRPLSKTGTTDAVYCEYICEKYPPERFQCYDKKQRQVRGLTEALWAAMLLPTIAVTDRYDKLGIGTCYNVRPMTGRKDVLVGNMWAPMPIVCSRTNDPNMTIAELGTEMRKDLVGAAKRKDWLTSLKSSWSEYDSRRFKGLAPIVSSAGVWTVGDYVVDFWGQQAMKNINVGTILVIAQSIAGPNGMEIYTRLQYSPSTISKEDAELCFKMIMHVLLHVPSTTTLREAVDELRKLRQKKP